MRPASSKNSSFQKPTARRIENGNGERVRWRAAGDRRDGPQKRDQIGCVLRRHPLVGCVREGRVKMSAVRGNAREQGVGDVDIPPTADPIGRIARYIGRKERPEWRLELKPAAELQRIFLARSCMAGFAAPGEEH